RGSARRSRETQIWPDLSPIERLTDATLRGLASPKLLELRELIGQIALAQERKMPVFSQWRRMLRLAHWATRPARPRGRQVGILRAGSIGHRRMRRSWCVYDVQPLPQ